MPIDFIGSYMVKLVRVGNNFATSDVPKHLEIQGLCECLSPFLNSRFSPGPQK